ncbi:MAG: efflux RND transporter periplasmic adaptor subunit [Pseudomonadota bacterium]|nr:efflux RND transporter periplasmic adaptor subunit [Pseudomonadota bacterium]QKK06281.1 MAG: efflux RND transporter periplasmic adaptor subunit [Pseudomonadota bacterium]
MSKGNRKSVLILIVIAALAVAGISFVQNKPLIIDVMPLHENVTVEVYGLGSVEAKTISRIGFEVGAALVELDADYGDSVKEGSVLAQLHSAEQQAKTMRAAAAVEAAEARLKKAQTTIPKLKAILDFHRISNQRAKVLLPRGSIGEEEAEQKQLNEEVATAEVEIARNDVALAKAELAEAQSQYELEKTLLDHHVLKAPYDALVVERRKELGTVISAGDPVFTLVDPRTVWVLGYIDEARAGGILVGQSVRVRLRSLPHKEFDGKVTRIDIESDRVSEERRVYVSCSDCPKDFYLGEQAEIFIHTATLEQPLLVPETAVEQFDGTGGDIWVIQKNRLHRISVVFGHKTLDGHLEITGGIDADAAIVATHLPGLRENRRVIIKKER